MSIELIRAAHEQQRKLLDELGCSLKIQEAWPEAFDLGPVTCVLIGTKDGRNMRYVVKRSDGQEREFGVELFK